MTERKELWRNENGWIMESTFEERSQCPFPFYTIDGKTIPCKECRTDRVRRIN